MRVHHAVLAVSGLASGAAAAATTPAADRTATAQKCLEQVHAGNKKLGATGTSLDAAALLTEYETLGGVCGNEGCTGSSTFTAPQTVACGQKKADNSAAAWADFAKIVGQGELGAGTSGMNVRLGNWMTASGSSPSVAYAVVTTALGDHASDAETNCYAGYQHGSLAGADITDVKAAKHGNLGVLPAGSAIKTTYAPGVGFYDNSDGVNSAKDYAVTCNAAAYKAVLGMGRAACTTLFQQELYMENKWTKYEDATTKELLDVKNAGNTAALTVANTKQAAANLKIGAAHVYEMAASAYLSVIDSTGIRFSGASTVTKTTAAAGANERCRAADATSIAVQNSPCEENLLKILVANDALTGADSSTKMTASTILVDLVASSSSTPTYTTGAVTKSKDVSAWFVPVAHHDFPESSTLTDESASRNAYTPNLNALNMDDSALYGGKLWTYTQDTIVTITKPATALDTTAMPLVCVANTAGAVTAAKQYYSCTVGSLTSDGNGVGLRKGDIIHGFPPVKTDAVCTAAACVKAAENNSDAPSHTAYEHASAAGNGKVESAAVAQAVLLAQINKGGKFVVQNRPFGTFKTVAGKTKSDCTAALKTALEFVRDERCMVGSLLVNMQEAGSHLAAFEAGEGKRTKKTYDSTATIDVTKLGLLPQIYRWCKVDPESSGGGSNPKNCTSEGGFKNTSAFNAYKADPANKCKTTNGAWSRFGAVAVTAVLAVFAF